jgi:hypothetical protein
LPGCRDSVLNRFWKIGNGFYFSKCKGKKVLCKGGEILLNINLTKIYQKYEDAVDSCKILSSEFNMHPRQELIDDFNQLARAFKQLSQECDELNLNEGLNLNSLSLMCEKLAARARLVSLSVLSNNHELLAEALEEINIILREAYIHKKRYKKLLASVV